MSRTLSILVPLLCAVGARAQLSLGTQFPTGASSVALAFDSATGTVWTYPAFGASLLSFSASGTPLGSIPRPGGSANDADLQVAPTALSLNGTPIPAGSLMFIDGEAGTAEIHAVDPGTGAVLATLATAFGSSHVVGGAYHAQRGTFFLVQDRVPSVSAERSLVAEVDPATGQVLNSFQLTQANPNFTVNYGDLDIAPSGNLLIVSSDETEIGEFTPVGAWVAGHALPSGVSSLCGIGRDASGCGLWVVSTSGVVSSLSATCPTAAPYGNACPSSGGSNTLAASNLPWVGSTFVSVGTGMPAQGFVLAATSLVSLPAPLALNALLPQAPPGCSLYVTPDLNMLLPLAGGGATLQLQLPATPVLVGLPFHQQMAAVELNGVGGIVAITSTNALRMVIGSY